MKRGVCGCTGVGDAVLLSFCCQDSMIIVGVVCFHGLWHYCKAMLLQWRRRPADRRWLCIPPQHAAAAAWKSLGGIDIRWQG